ncbi:transposase [Chryseobacterium aahli]|uniref:transposase n=1 Tax=Chryseobacterium aahli TaxID=1278643 RepID=UPI001F61FC6A|nr:transposase [Chryseobacterium aahli]MCI3936503.1 transposase [Chryseobacterium aahli]
MRKFLFILSFIFSNLLFGQDEGSLRKFAKKNKDLLSLNAIVADKTYYSQAILEYQIVKKLIDLDSKSDIIKKDFILKDSKTNDLKVINRLVNQMTVLPNLLQSDYDSIQIKNCKYVIPERIDDLKSGFQFRHYLFRGENTTALQAFGIISNEFSKKDLYVVIDYIQYQDCGCSNLPTVRYAVGIRSEFKISGMTLNKDNDENSKNLNIEKLAASVQFDKLKVDISMKTIGITGKPARLNIPTNTSFNVQTYGEYVKVIDFIRNTLDSNEVTIQPEIIPVMDAYRTSIADINTMAFEELFEIRNRYDEYASKLSKLKKKENYDEISAEISNILQKSLLEEIRSKNEKNIQLTMLDTNLKDLKRYVKIIDFLSLNRVSNKIEVKNEDKYSTLNEKYNNAISLLINKESEKAKIILEEIFKEKRDYGNVQEILNLIKNGENKPINDTILKEFSWLISNDNVQKLKKSEKK